MFSRAAATSALRGTGRVMRSSSKPVAIARRNMAGGHWMEVSKVHTFWGEAFGVFCWVWVFHRARHDLPVVLGWRHPWEHAEDPFAPDIHLNEKALEADWYKTGKDMALIDDDADEDDEDEEDEEEDDDE